MFLGFFKASYIFLSRLIVANEDKSSVKLLPFPPIEMDKSTQGTIFDIIWLQTATKGVLEADFELDVGAFHVNNQVRAAH